ncbi:ATP-binding protein, partial [Streptomyces sp. SID2131]|nr:ATP-binding protein [Streptomyces sp. SID2131]
EVADASDRPPKPRHAHGDDTNGRGLELVDGLADRWGWQPEGRGKSIWCEVDRAPVVPAPVGPPGVAVSPGRVPC